MKTQRAPRVVIAGIILESNAFAPVVPAGGFTDYVYLEGDDLLSAARTPESPAPRELASFVQTMDATGPWEPLPLVVTASPPGGPADHEFIEDILCKIESALAKVDGVDAVYIANHGAMTSTKHFDADGEIVKRIRQAAGADARIVMTLDLHANISDSMVSDTDCIIGYRTNPHVDQVQCGEEAAVVMRQLLAKNYDCASALVRLPIAPPTTTLLTRAGPYADIIAFGQRRCAELGGSIINVSVFGGFVFSDTPKNGIAVVVTARHDQALAQMLATEIAEYTWSIRKRFRRPLTSSSDAIELAHKVAQNPDEKSVIFSDAGDNPGGGGSGNTSDFLGELIAADAVGVLYGSFFEPEIAQRCVQAGIGAKVSFELNASSPKGTGDSLKVDGKVVALGDGDIVGRRGIFNGRRLPLGNMAAIKVGASGGITIVLLSMRVQTADPMMFESLGLEIGDARVVVVKSRGHFRAGFDLWFEPEQVYEVDTPGYTSPVLERFNWSGLPRPVFPLDADVHWEP